MTYKKPHNIRYTDMAIFIDENIYKDDLEESTINLIFEYLYHLSYMLAKKANFFNQNHYYDDFAIYVATSVYMRLRNEKQFILGQDGFPKMKKVKSVLNYLKSVLYPRKVSFEQQQYYQGLSQARIVDNEDTYVESNFLLDCVDDFYLVHIDCYFDTVEKTVRNFLSKIPYYSDKVLWNNIYISCLLTILSSLTFSYEDRFRCKTMKYKNGPDSDLVESIYKKNRSDSPILFHIPEQMEDYIKVLCNEIRHLIATDLSLIFSESISTECNEYVLLEEINGFRIEELGGLN